MPCLCGGGPEHVAPTDYTKAGCSGRGVHTTSCTHRSGRSTMALPFASLSQATLSKPKAPDASVGGGSAAGSSGPADKPAHDVVAGAMARAASQSTIHPLDTMKVRMQAGVRASGAAASSSGSTVAGVQGLAAGLGAQMPGRGLARKLAEVASLYKGVVSAATGAGVIIGAYFAFSSTCKRFLKQKTNLADGQVAFVSGAAAAVGSSVVKVPIAVCIRSVQAGVYPNVAQAARSIVGATGIQGLFTGFLPTLLEDIPDMAVKFAVYETLRSVLTNFNGGRQPSTAEDLLMGGTAGAAAAAATTPLDVVKTRMMCVAASRPTFLGAASTVMQQGGPAAFFRGVGPRALSNGLNSAVFFCFFEAIRRGLVTRLQAQQQQLSALSVQEEPQAAAGAAAAVPAAAAASDPVQQRAQHTSMQQEQRHGQSPQLLAMAATSTQQGKSRARGSSGGGRMACLSLAVPLHLVVPARHLAARM